MIENKRKTANTLILILTSLIWGGGFISQSIGAGYVGAYTFLALRSWLAVIALIPVVYFFVIKKAPEGLKSVLNKDSLKGGIVCGLMLFLASAAQQLGIAYTTTAKAGFLTAMYVVMVPIICFIINRAGRLFLKRSFLQDSEKTGLFIWLGVMLTLAGLYLLCLKDSFSFEKGDLLMMLCALLFAFQIISINHFVKKVEPVLLAWLEFFFTALFSSVFMFIFENPSVSALSSAAPSIIFAGLFSSAMGYTLQIVGQKGLNPTVASIIMSLESVFSAILGWLILGQSLTVREIAGCVLMFTAIIVSQL